MSNKLILLNSKLLCLMPLALVAGPFIAEIIVLLSIIIVNYDLFKKKKFEYLNNFYFKFFLLFWLYLTFSNIFNSTNFEELLKQIFFFRFGLFVVAVTYTINLNKNFLKDFSFYLSFVILVLIVDGYFQYFTGENLLGLEIQNQRISSLFGEEKVLGTFLVRMTILLIGIKIFLNEKNFKYHIVFFLLTTDILIFLSGDRAPFFLLNISAIYLIIMCKDLKLLRSIILFTSIIIILAISFSDNQIKDRVFTKTFEDFGLLDSKPTYTIENNRSNFIMSPQHENYYTVAYRIFRDKPYFGSGTSSFKYLCNEDKYKIDQYSCSSHPHNIYLELLSETGVVGFGFIFSLLLCLIYFSLKHLYLKFFYKQIIFKDYEICYLACFLINLWPLTPTGSFFNNWLSILYFLPLGFFISSKIKKNHLT